MYNVHCTNTILHNYGVLRNTPSSANINRLNWEGGCYVSRILLISHWQNHTNIHKHGHTQAHEVTLLKNPNTQNNTQKPKDTHTQNTDKHQDTQTLTNTDGQTQNCSSLHIRISCHCLFCPNWNESPSTMLVSFILLSYFYASTFVLLFSIFHCPGTGAFL